MPERAGRPDPRRTTPPTEAALDPEHGSPLGRGANPGAVEAPGLDAPGIAGPHGHDVPGATRGRSGTLTRSNEDADPATRD